MPALDHVGDPGVVSAPRPWEGLLHAPLADKGPPPVETSGLPLLPIMCGPPGEQLWDPVAHVPHHISLCELPGGQGWTFSPGADLEGDAARFPGPLSFWGLPRCQGCGGSQRRAVREVLKVRTLFFLGWDTLNAYPRVLGGAWGD